MRKFTDYEHFKTNVLESVDIENQERVLGQVLGSLLQDLYPDAFIDGETDEEEGIYRAKCVDSNDQTLADYTEDKKFNVRLFDIGENGPVVIDEEGLKRLYELYDRAEPPEQAEIKNDSFIEEKSIDLPVDKIKPSPHQVRANFNQVPEIADSLRLLGQLHNISVVKREDKYELIQGEQRLRAAKLIGWKEIRADIYKDFEDLYFLSQAENLSRTNPSLSEQGKIIADTRIRIKKTNKAPGIPEVMPKDRWEKMDDEWKEDWESSNKHINRAIQQLYGISITHQYRLVNFLLEAMKDETGEQVLEIADEGINEKIGDSLVLTFSKKAISDQLMNSLLEKHELNEAHKRADKRARDKKDADTRFLDIFKFMERIHKKYDELRNNVSDKTYNDTRERVKALIAFLQDRFGLLGEESKNHD